MSYLIKDTTKQQRKQIVKRAYAISLASGEEPSNETLEEFKEYVDGKTELKEIQERIISKYRK